MTTPRINWSNAWRATRGGRLLPKLRSLKIAAVSTRPIGLTYKGIAGTRDRAKCSIMGGFGRPFHCGSTNRANPFSASLNYVKHRDCHTPGSSVKRIQRRWRISAGHSVVPGK